DKLTQSFVSEVLDIVEKELAREDSKLKITRKTYQGIEAVSIGPDAHVAVMGAAVVVSNKPDVLKAAVDLHLGKGKQAVTANPNLAAGRKLLPDNPAAWLWVNLDHVRTIPQAKEFFEFPKVQAFFNLNFIPPIIDVARRSPYLAAGVYLHGQRFSYT